MASIRFSSIVSAVAGKVGGVIFARGANGNYVKSFGRIVNKNTAFQQIKRNNLAVYAAKWRGLTDEQRQSWIDGAPQFKYQNRVGETSQYTGFQLYMKTNLVLETAALDT